LTASGGTRMLTDRSENTIIPGWQAQRYASGVSRSSLQLQFGVQEVCQHSVVPGMPKLPMDPQRTMIMGLGPRGG
jgi:hypothetical protein